MIRIPPAIYAYPSRVDASDVTNVFSLTLNMMYDDGFAAYLNGTKVASRNAP